VTAEAQALEATRLRLEELQKSLDERARQRPQVSSRRHRQLFPPADNPEVYRTPIQNVAAAAKIADSIQPSNSEAGRGIEQIRALLGAARQQNSAISQSRNRIHSKSPRADTVQSAHSEPLILGISWSKRPESVRFVGTSGRIGGAASPGVETPTRG
jgi:hypothetical protein